MCTTGAIVLIGEGGKKRVFGFKTSDSPWTGFWHGQVNRPDGHDALAYGLIPQQGVNAGMNSQGLTVISSYFGYEEPGSSNVQKQRSPNDNPYWGGDLRGIVQAEVLATCKTVADAKAVFTASFGNVTAPVGGNHIIVDEAGDLTVFEHCLGRTEVQDAAEQRYVARSNQSFLLFKEEQSRMTEKTRLDRGLRLEQAERVLAELKRDEAKIDDAEVIRRLKQLISVHIGAGDEAGSICAHGVIGGRSNSAEPHETISAQIWDISGRSMYYTIGHPCRSAWQMMQFIN